MKKAVSLILALMLCLALAVPAFAVDLADLYLGDAYQAGADEWDVIPRDQQGVVGRADFADARIDLVPSLNVVNWADVYYWVSPDDTVAAIAFAFYGRNDAAVVNALIDANKNGHFLVSGGVLEAGRPFRIPAVLSNGVNRLDVLGLAFYPVTIASVRIAPSMDALPTVHAYNWATYQSQFASGLDRLNQIIYRVQPGDTLSSIATAFYGNNGDHIIGAIKAANSGDIARISGNTLAADSYIILPVITIGY